MAQTRTWRDALTWARGELADFPEREARWMVETAAGRDAGELIDALDEQMPVRAADRLGVMLARRRAGEPLQYVLGRWGFRSLDLVVDDRVLIPRPETEVVAEHAVAAARDFAAPNVVDLGTGSGALALTVTSEVPTARVWASDISDDALAVARANLAGLGRAAIRVRLVRGWWFEALPEVLRGSVHVLVSNPPYVASGELAELDAAVRDHEPHDALVAGPTGLEALAVIVNGAAEWLAPDGALICEIAPHQRDAVIALAVEAGLADVVVQPDLAGRDRVLTARRGATKMGVK